MLGWTVNGVIIAGRIKAEIMQQSKSFCHRMQARHVLQLCREWRRKWEKWDKSVKREKMRQKMEKRAATRAAKEKKRCLWQKMGTMSQWNWLEWCCLCVKWKYWLWLCGSVAYFIYRFILQRLQLTTLHFAICSMAQWRRQKKSTNPSNFRAFQKYFHSISFMFDCSAVVYFSIVICWKVLYSGSCFESICFAGQSGKQKSSIGICCCGVSVCDKSW